MAEAIRRLLWMTLFACVGSIVLFVLLARAPTISRRFGLPTFFNPNPVSAESAALGAMELTVHGALGGAERLAALGGAALPHVLPRLRSLSVGDRRRVVRALAPVLHRMELGRPNGLAYSSQGAQLQQQDDELVFWERYYEDHDLDFKPLAVQRLVRRLAEHGTSLRHAELAAVDTYALPALVAQLGRVSSARDVQRLQRLVPSLSRLTDQNWQMPAGASVASGRDVATAIRAYWERHGSAFTQFDRLQALAAGLRQTEFALWAQQTGRQVSGVDSRSLFAELRVKASRSSMLLLFSLLGALGLGPALAVCVQLASIREKQWTRHQLRARLPLSFLLVLFVPGALLRAPQSTFLQAALALSSGTIAAAFLLQRELTDRLDWRAHSVLRARPPAARALALWRWLAPTLPTFLPLAVAESLLWSACIEIAAHRDGLGVRTTQAFAAGDMPWLMAVCLSTWLAIGATQALSDVLWAAKGPARGVA